MENGVDPIPQPPGRDSLAKAVRLVALILAIPAVAVAYYFAISLPAHNQARLQIEYQRHTEELKRSEAVAKDAGARKEMLQACLQKADDSYFTYLKLNGTVAKDGSISTSSDVGAVADKRRSDDRDTCFRQFGR